MTLTEVTFAIAALLITPGPTNTLLAVAGAERGVARAIRLIPAELGGYLTTVIPLTILGVEVLSDYPALKPVVTVLAALWVMWLAVAMWRLPVAAGAGATVVTAGRVFVTTLLNPKALIFGLAILPSETAVRWNIGIFAVQIVVVAVLWAALGSVLSRQRGLPVWLRRSAALWLAVVSVGLFTRLLTP